MKSIKIIATGKYLPVCRIDNKNLEDDLELPENFIYNRTGIRTRYYSKNEEIYELAIKSVENLLLKNKKIEIDEIDMVIVATTSTNLLMPGISYKIQEYFKIKNCMCLDILAGCAGYINAFDIARNYIAIEKIKRALVIGVDLLSKNIDKKDISTSIILSDGASATIIENAEEDKLYESNILSQGENGNLLITSPNENIKMNGKEIYKYAVTETVSNVNKLLEMAKLDIQDITYVIPHQSNMKIIKSIANRLSLDKNKLYVNIENVGNTFCASIPIAIDEMLEKKLLKDNDKIILIGYGGGLNTGSILMEV